MFLIIVKESGCEVVIEWIRLCINYLYWSVMLIVCGSGRIILVKFKFFFSYIINKYLGLDDFFFNKCVYGDIRYRRWFLKG